MPYGNPRDDITDTIMQQQKMGPVGAGFAGLAGAMPANMPTQMPTGMPQTPGGGVPGSGLGMAPPSNMPQQPMMQPKMQGMGTMPELSSIPWMGQPTAMPQGVMQGSLPQAMPAVRLPQERRRTIK